jgi:hypothetical protein
MRKDDSISHKEESMSEDYRTVEVRGEPLPAGCVGARVRVGLSDCPSRRWSRQVSARLASELIGHAAVGHLRLNELVQGDEIVLEGVEASEAPALGGALKRAIDATNRAHPSAQHPTANMTREQADAIANQIAPEPRPVPSARSAIDTGDEVTPSCWFG